MNNDKNEGAVKLLIKLGTALLITAVAAFAIYYFLLPPLNIFSKGFWIYLFVVLALFASLMGVFNFGAIASMSGQKQNYKGRSTAVSRESMIRSDLFSKIMCWIVPLPIVVIILGSIISATMFNASRYASLINVSEREFETDMPKTTEVTNIALMDSESAKILGNRKLGALANVVSQYVVNGEYTQINYQGKPMKITNLEYDGFFKWLNNNKNGVPGYIMVDAIGNTAEYYELEKPMKYTYSAYFSNDLMRKLRFDYPTKIFGNISFEADEQGNVYFIVSCMAPRVGLFGAMDVSEVILFDPTDGTSTLCKPEEVPTWVDIVYDGYLACRKYDWQGTLSGGFINSVIGNEGCKRTTDDFGYIMLDDDVWYFTGVTSVTSDESNIGFILSCARTGEYKFYSVIGAEEYSAMGAAQGEVQEKGYVASFPSLVNIAGEPSYIMVLKDANGLVKQYALVNVRQYSMVATGETQSQAIAAYLKILSQNGIDTSGSQSGSEKEITISDIKYINMSGVTYVYITDEGGAVYRIEFSEKNEGIIFAGVGDKLKISAASDSSNGINIVVSWKFAE